LQGCRNEKSNNYKKWQQRIAENENRNRQNISITDKFILRGSHRDVSAEKAASTALLDVCSVKYGYHLKKFKSDRRMDNNIHNVLAVVYWKSIYSAHL
jgi:hypothetical protein